MKVFISGMITNDSNYKMKFDAAEKRLLERGHLVWNPARHPFGFEHDEYLRVCMAALEFCDLIYLLNGWNWSEGSQMEVMRAIELGKVIKTEAEDD